MQESFFFASGGGGGASFGVSDRFTPGYRPPHQ